MMKVCLPRLPAVVGWRRAIAPALHHCETSDTKGCRLLPESTLSVRGSCRDCGAAAGARLAGTPRAQHEAPYVVSSNRVREGEGCTCAPYIVEPPSPSARRSERLWSILSAGGCFPYNACSHGAVCMPGGDTR